MKFTVSTKPLKNSLNLCIINANVSKYYSKSLLAQITANSDTLRINHAANSILSEVKLKGLGDDGVMSIMVDCLLLKQLISTINTSQIEFDFSENALMIRAGKSSFSLPKLMDTSEVQLSVPKSITENDLVSSNDVTKSDWKFIKEYQMYAKSDSTVNPVYTYIWVGEHGDVLVGDYVNSLFTHSTVSKLGKTCLLTDTVVNLFNILPDGAKIITRHDTYSISVCTDGYEYTSEFVPIYESDEIGNYNSEIIMNMMGINKSEESNTGISKVNVADINIVLNQAALLSTSKDPQITCTFEKNQIIFEDSRINCTIPAEGGIDISYTLIFKSNSLKSVILNCPESMIGISPIFNDGEIVGITISSGRLTVVLAGVE